MAAFSLATCCLLFLHKYVVTRIHNVPTISLTHAVKVMGDEGRVEEHRIIHVHKRISGKVERVVFNASFQSIPVLV